MRYEFTVSALVLRTNECEISQKIRCFTRKSVCVRIFLLYAGEPKKRRHRMCLKPYCETKCLIEI